MDLLVIAAMMYGADTRINREEQGEDSWTRMIDLYVPVSDPGLWQQQADNIQKIFRFLTGDIWTLNFRPRHADHMAIAPQPSRIRRFQMPYKTDTVCLFSGGMDSFIGAIDLISQGIRHYWWAIQKAAT
ncbi:hypothetical protein [Chitinophaga pinensis]|uniref:Uncharacterized protein n=1 Tax=Chitinophaga pinensis TaxID=79329 RepID=A0A5C6LUN8_9BACT|nr:hypothetical protein [Chitinophaga pinensis]TWW01095.1 hypothetical protein FEF09_09025 [Chitinophaga pinensis]